MGDQFQLLFALDAGNLEGFIGLPGAAGMIARLETEDVFWEYLQLTERDFSDEEDLIYGMFPEGGDDFGYA